MFIEVTEVYYKYGEDDGYEKAGSGPALVNTEKVVKVSLDLETGSVAIELEDGATVHVEEDIATLVHELNAEFI